MEYSIIAESSIGERWSKGWTLFNLPFTVFFKKTSLFTYLFVYLLFILAAPGLSCGM